MDKTSITIPPFLSDMIILDLFQEDSTLASHHNVRESQLRDSILYFYPHDVDRNVKLCNAGLIHTVLKLVQTFDKDLPYLSHSIESAKKRIHVLCSKDQRHALAVTIQHPITIKSASKPSININNLDTEYRPCLLEEDIGESILRSIYQVICLLYESISNVSTACLDHIISSVNNHFFSILTPWQHVPTITLTTNLALDLIFVYEQFHLENIESFCVFYKGFLLCNRNMNDMLLYIYHYFYLFDQPIHCQQQSGSLRIYSQVNTNGTFCRNSDFILFWLDDSERNDMSSFQSKILSKLLQQIASLNSVIKVENESHIKIFNNQMFLRTRPSDNVVLSLYEYQKTGYIASKVSKDNERNILCTFTEILTQKNNDLDSLDNQNSYLDKQRRIEIKPTASRTKSTVLRSLSKIAPKDGHGLDSYRYRDHNKADQSLVLISKRRNDGLVTEQVNSSSLVILYRELNDVKALEESPSKMIAKF